MTTNITVDDEVHKTLKIESAKQGKSIKNVVGELVEDEYGGIEDGS